VPSRAGRQAGRQPVFGPRHRKRVRWLATYPRPLARERAEAGTEPQQNGTRRDRTRAPQSRRARRRREIAGAPRREWRGVISRGAAVLAEASGSVAGTRVTRARPSSWRRSAPVEPHRRRRREPVGPPPVGRARPRRRKEVKARTGRIATRSPVARPVLCRALLPAAREATRICSAPSTGRSRP